ncbi:MAG TPA: saccharopine dehydrogenase C-terminal domain-containing protein, partial [Rhodothermales bacterium]|nr:saccharopine dehydrogenase C-terminal domain-containing protein [Rhodothermales bacterium]
EVTRVRVCEARPAVLRTFRAWLQHPALKTYEADARDERALAPLLAGSDVVVSCVAPEHGPRLAALALTAGAHYVDLGGPEASVESTLALRPLAEQRQRWVVPNAGFAPGLVNVLGMRAVGRFTRPIAARILAGDVPTEPREPFSHRLSHSAEKLLEDYTHPVAVLRHGRVEHCPPLTGLEPVEFGHGFDTMEAFYAAGGLDTLAHVLQGRLDRLDVKTLRWPGHADQMRFLLDLGLADRTVLDVRTHLTYRDVLLRRLRQRLGGDYRDAVLARVEVDGYPTDADSRGDGAPADGATRTLVYELVDRYDEETGLSAMRRCTAFPAAAVAVLLAQGAVEGGGAAPPEAVIPPEPFVAALAARGITVTERWLDEPVAA